ncbi:MAG: exodeoxyribonuclease V subunit beta [Candidatus Sedimenticola sp. (ex Thyasira tokunagai)]
MERLDLFNTPLQGVNLIEASAGTGKTYTISGLYIRMVIEQQLPVERILVVTYTKAATAELRERIRTLLVAMRSVLEGGDSDDTLCQQLLESVDDQQDALKRVNLAILSFDRAAIFTIHGFCQRALSDAAFEGGLPFHIEMVADDRDLRQEIVDDFWRISIQDLPYGLLNYFTQKRVTPDTLLKTLKGNLGKPYLTVRAQKMPDDLATLEATYDRLFQEVMDLWTDSRQEVSDLLFKALQEDQLNKRSYPENKISIWLDSLNTLFVETRGAWFDHFDRFTRSKLESSTKKGKLTPEHPFFDLCDRLWIAQQSLSKCYEQARVACVAELIAYADSELRLRKAERRLHSYDDLLLNLDEALRGDLGERLVGAIRHCYGAALIDEFQDTDPIQYRIFRRLFASGDEPLFLVGDPKQAIYSFRGADIFAYLEAQSDAAHCYTLDTNWRSSPGLISAVNTLFGASQRSFLFDDIPFHDALPASDAENRLKVEGDTTAPFNICFIDGKLTKEAASGVVAEWTASEISRLLAAAREGKAFLGERPLRSGDIAVLVRSHKQGSMVANALTNLGIHSVQRSRASVFHSTSGVELERILRAVAEPLREPLLPAALATGVIGFDSHRLESLQDDPAALDSWMASFQNYHNLWLQYGFMRMFRCLLEEQGVAGRLLQCSDGERRLTDLLHLGELLHTTERSESPGMEGLVMWLSRHCSGDMPDDEAHQLRLESDEALVQIVTVHTSKGLQYPVVFYPFAWDSGVHNIKVGESYQFHDPNMDHQAVLDLGSDSWKSDQLHADREGMAESLRLLYVALTRAEQRCYIHWGKINGADQSPLGWLLHGPSDPDAADALQQMKSGFKSHDGNSLQMRVEQLIGCADGNLSLSLDVPMESASADSGGDIPRPEPKARSFSRFLKRTRQLTSFSALSSGYHEMSELPDHDGASRKDLEVDGGGSRYDIFHFPRGAAPGSALHAIFEELDFNNYTEAELSQLVKTNLEKYAIDSRWSRVVEKMVAEVLTKELEQGSGLRLENLTARQCLVELEFYYPINRLTTDGLAQLLLQHGFADTPEIERAISELEFLPVQGYLKGYIDLTFEQGGRYYLLDYKSNWLGGEKSDYGRQQLNESMAREGYYLQYLLYTLALHRYLRQRLPGYHYEQHFGAVFYLFLRGIDVSDNSDLGIYRERPDWCLIEALDNYFYGVENNDEARGGEQ